MSSSSGNSFPCPGPGQPKPGRVLRFPGEVSITPDPDPCNSGRPQLVERTNAIARTPQRLTSMLPVNRAKFINSVRKQLSDTCRYYGIELWAGEGILLNDLREREMRRRAA